MKVDKLLLTSHVTANELISVTLVSRYAVRACQSQVLYGVYTELGCFGSVARMVGLAFHKQKILFLKIKQNKNRQK